MWRRRGGRVPRRPPRPAGRPARRRAAVRPNPGRYASWTRPSCVPYQSPPLLDPSNLQARQPLTVTLTLVVAGLVLELVDADLGALGVFEHLAGHRHLGQRLGVRGDLGTVDDQGDRQRHLGARLELEFLDL